MADATLKIFSQEQGWNSSKKNREQARNSATGLQGGSGRRGLMITSVFPSSSPSPPPPPRPHVERCQGPVSCPSSCNLYRNIAAGRSCRLSGKERSRRDSRSLERSWRNVGRRKWFPILEFWTRIGRNLLFADGPHGNSPWDMPTRCFRGARFSAARFCTKWFSWKRRYSIIRSGTILIKVSSTFRYIVVRRFRFFTFRFVQITV